MTSIWNYRLIIYCDIQKADAANLLAQQQDPDPACGLNSFSVRLSPDGYEPATHLGMNTAATMQMQAGYEGALDDLPWSGLYNVETGTTWDWDGTQQDQLLRTVQSYGGDIDGITAPPWVGRGTHVRICILAPADWQPDNVDAQFNYGGDDTLHTWVITTSAVQAAAIVWPDNIYEMWREAV